MERSDRLTGSEMRERLLQIAEGAVLAKGFGATSIEELIAEAGITKNGFFYHFRDKNALALALLERYMERDEALLDAVFSRGRELSDDPLQAFLIGLKLLAEKMADLPQDFPGCLVATFCYQERLFDRDVHALNHEIVLKWRARFRRNLDAIAAEYTPAEAVDLDALADMVSTAIEGGLVLGRATGSTKILPEQIMLTRNYIKLLFATPSSGG
ncbi:TetR/AcrR family transcriptional regulator [Chelativorans sp. M5D2P16]|uniref:TetR/AcrR family transcriptional regulator n=1 Tax=Chelativorans sp. M5D2P16 TaxID=3095678 RepID=UPI002AC9F9D6|nr:TetR/AcrR family transcriptional regulator [Chelativorans sp. M5D2P16]MDZ5699066.1 TetR/AcrR family transcriptional regulator [Chelativorans sp. M5D2P16]